MNIYRLVVYTIIFLAILPLTGCYEPEQGCLDARATNFSLDADEACADCCTYPELKVRFTHRWETADTSLAFQTSSVYRDGMGQPFRFQRLRFYWSEVELLRVGTGPLAPTDSVEIGYVQGADTSLIRVLDNFALATAGASATTVSVGEVQPEGTAYGLAATFGIREPANRAAVTSLPSKHPLAPQAGSMNLGADKGYVFAKIELFRDTIASDTIPLILNIYGADFLRDLQLPLSTASPLVEGFTPRANVTVNYAIWFNGVDVRSADTTAMKQQIVSNLTQAFQFTELIYE